jgi:hypothetical protein
MSGLFQKLYPGLGCDGTEYGVSGFILVSVTVNFRYGQCVCGGLGFWLSLYTFSTGIINCITKKTYAHANHSHISPDTNENLYKRYCLDTHCTPLYSSVIYLRNNLSDWLFPNANSSKLEGVQTSLLAKCSINHIKFSVSYLL